MAENSLAVAYEELLNKRLRSCVLPARPTPPLTPSVSARRQAEKEAPSDEARAGGASRH